MRQETNNEIDLLLRRLGRRQKVSMSDAGSDHLDADELSSYAENALPPAARARYTEHLAECSRCRELVVQLSASVPVAAAKETVTAAGPSGLRKFLASFFSPMVLRYAVPALGVIVVAAIGFVVLRSNRPANEVAQLDQSGQTKSPAVSNEQPQVSASGDQSAGFIASASPAARPEGHAGKTKEAQETQAPAPPNAPPSVSSVRVEPKAADAPAPKPEEQTAANEPPPQPAPTPTPTVDEMKVEVEGRKATAQNRAAPAGAVARQKTPEGFKDAERKPEESASVATAKTKRTETEARGQLGAGSTYSVDGTQDKADGVTRRVAGRRFCRQGGVWVDTAYTSGSEIVNIKRGSEQYRALVGDEPSIKTIADELEGTIIVVWKRSTYRIR